MIHAFYETKIIRMLRHAWEILRYLNTGNVRLDGLVRTANLCWCVGFHVPRIQLRWSADQHQHNAVDVFIAVRRSSAFQPEELSKTQTKSRKRTRMKEIPPADSVAEFNGTVGIQT